LVIQIAQTTPAKGMNINKIHHHGTLAIFNNNNNILINIYILLLLLKIARVPWWWILLIFIPFAGVVWAIWMTNRVIKGFGKSEGFTIGCIFFPFIFYPILGFGSATYDPNRLEQIE
jgi:hypothetical protein